MKATKTFKIGEYAKGGVITVNVTDKDVTIIGKDWDFSKGSNKSSDQSNAVPFSTKVISLESRTAYRELLDELCDLTTSFYADEIIEWIETKTKQRLKNLMSW